MRDSVPSVHDVMTEDEAAEYLQRPASTLRQWRYRGEGPPYVKQGTARRSYVRYLRRDLDEWLAAGRVVPQKVPS